MVRRQTLVILVTLSLAAGAIIAATYVTDISRGSLARQGCTRSPGGFLIIASNTGYNGSELHGAPNVAWPVIKVSKGSTVSITVCNTDHQAHGFQITHYFDGSIETVLPGQALEVSFVADQPGTFQIYCSIFCTVHIYMQSGQLVVS